MANYKSGYRLKSRLAPRRAIPLLFLAAGAAHAENATHYQLDVGIEPATHQLTVSAAVELPPEFVGRTVEFLLTSALRIDDSEPKPQRLPYEQGGFTGINGSSVVLGKLDAIARYRVTLPEGSSTLKLSYGGTVNFPLSSPEEEYARGIIETAGTVNGDGVYLAGGTLWYPYFSDELVSFELTAAAPDGWRLISQGNGSSRDQAGTKFALQAPLALTTSDGLETQVLSVTGAATPFKFETASQPQLLEVDPQFDLFRLLDARETAPSIGQVLGDRKLVAILLAAADEATRAAYRGMVERWRSPTQDMTIVLDTEIEADELPADAAAWILGRDNRFAQVLFQSDPALGLTVSGEWANSDSPLRADLRSAEQRAAGPVTAAPKPARKPLAELPAVFSEERLQQHVDHLTSPEMEGRGLGSPQLEEAAAYTSPANSPAAWRY